MAEKLDWDDCIRHKLALTMPPDIQRTKEVLKMAMLRLEFWSRPIEAKFAALKIEGYYEIIKEIAFALL